MVDGLGLIQAVFGVGTQEGPKNRAVRHAMATYSQC